ncbi:MAG: hypothetical protein PHW54_05105 [Candidatus Omnitrophica bacterium]|nr:hypothetical protein [Candidatus Omnitrophota bacterium]
MRILKAAIVLGIVLCFWQGNAFSEDRTEYFGDGLKKDEVFSVGEIFYEKNKLVTRSFENEVIFIVKKITYTYQGLENNNLKIMQVIRKDSNMVSNQVIPKPLILRLDKDNQALLKTEFGENLQIKVLDGQDGLSITQIKDTKPSKPAP